MRKKSKIVDTYTPNKQVLVTVTNTPKHDEEDNFVDYDRTVTIKIKAGRDKDTLQFKSDDSIAKFIEKVDFEDPQVSLLGSGN